MLDQRTFAYKIVRDFLRHKLSAIFLVGYIDPQSPGASLLNAVSGDLIRLIPEEDPIKVNCAIEKFQFPSHSSKEELLELVGKLNPAKIVLLHGDEKAISSLGLSILETYTNVKLYSAELGKTLRLDSI
jgi:Cft2 family RNA processing exonuclease